MWSNGVVTQALHLRTLVDAGEPAPAVPIALAHGFTQNSNCWGRFASRLGEAAPNANVVAIDAPGHGDSAHDDDDLTAAGERIVATGGRAHWIGYSMGGRMLLHAALTPGVGQMASLVLIGATGGIDDADDRRARRARDEDLADRIEELGTEAFIDEWLATPLFKELGAAAYRSERLANRADGMASSLRNCGTGTQVPLWDRLHTIDVPVLVIAGKRDTKFTELGRRLTREIGRNATFIGVPGGHAVHLEDPEAAAAAISWWSATAR